MSGRRLLLAGGLAAMLAAALLPLTNAPLAAAVALGIAGLVAALAAHNVPMRPTPADAEAARRLLAAAGAQDLERPRNFEEEVALAYRIQEIVLGVAPFEKRDSSGRKVPLPPGGPRELSDLVRAGHGYCYDRSRAIETLLRLHGLEARQVAIFVKGRGSASRALLGAQTGSHSLTEVKTERGWMVVDSNYRWIGLSKDGEPYDLAKLRAFPEVEWDARNGAMGPKLQEPFIFVYGLYSRHGRFYPPYSRFPNVNWRTFAANLGGFLGRR